VNFNGDGRIINGPEDRETAVCVCVCVCVWSSWSIADSRPTRMILVTLQ